MRKLDINKIKDKIYNINTVPDIDLHDRKDLLLQAIGLIKNECPNNDKGNLCSKYEDCLDCWQQELIKQIGIKFNELFLKDGENNMIKLDKNDESDREWFNED
jgi:hypothetical protein